MNLIYKSQTIVLTSEYQEKFEKMYFWRTHEQQEIDLIIEKNAQLKAIEIKWNPKAKAKLSQTFTKQYPNYSFEIVNSENFFEYII